MNQFRIAARQLLKNPGFAATAILTLAIAIGANTAIFGVIHAVLLQPLPYPEADRLVRIASVNASLGISDSRSSAPNIVDWQRQSSLFESIGAFQEWDGILTYNGKSEPARVNWATPNLLPMLGIKPLLGELLPAGEDPASGIVLPYGLWKTQFAGSPSIVGKWITEDGEQVRVTGVLEPAVAAPAQIAPATDQAFVRMNLPRVNMPRGWQLFNVVGRLKPGVTLDQAQAELASIASRLEQMYPDSNRGWTVKVTGLKSWMVAPIRGQLWTVYIATSVILLLACLNVSNLLLIRSAARRKELAIRCALGSSRVRLVQLLAVETILLGACGGVAGLCLAFLCQRLLAHVMPETVLNRAHTIHLWPSIFSTFACSAIATFCFGLAPALRLGRGDLTEALAEASRATPPKSRHRILGGLVVGQIAISTVLLVATGLAVLSFVKLTRVDPGFARDNSLFFRVGYLPDKKTEDRLLDAIGQVPGVKTVGGSHIELLNDTFSNPVQVTIDGKSDLTGLSGATVNFWLTTKDYFAAAGIPVLAGRTFEVRDMEPGTNAPIAAVINEAFAEKYFANENPIGKTLHIPGPNKEKPGRPRLIIGVVESVRQRGLRESAIPVLYAPYTDFATGSIAVVARTTRPPLTVIPAIRAAIQEVNPELIVTRMATAQQTVDRSLSGQRFATQLMSAFASLGTLLAAIGLYGVVTYAVIQRRKEIGIRIALGAGPARVVRMILREGMLLVAIGLFVGLLAALAFTRAMQVVLFNVTATDPWIYSAISSLLIVVATIACWFPARRATRIDPISALKAD